MSCESLKCYVELSNLTLIVILLFMSSTYTRAACRELRLSVGDVFVDPAEDGDEENEVSSPPVDVQELIVDDPDAIVCYYKLLLAMLVWYKLIADPGPGGA